MYLVFEPSNFYVPKPGCTRGNSKKQEEYKMFAVDEIRTLSHKCSMVENDLSYMNSKYKRWSRNSEYDIPPSNIKNFCRKYMDSYKQRHAERCFEEAKNNCFYMIKAYKNQIQSLKYDAELEERLGIC